MHTSSGGIEPATVVVAEMCRRATTAATGLSNVLKYVAFIRVKQIHAHTHTHTHVQTHTRTLKHTQDKQTNIHTTNIYMHMYTYMHTYILTKRHA